MKKISFDFGSTKYSIDSSSKFDKNLRIINKQGKDIEKLIYVVERLANGEILEVRYNNHKLVDSRNFKDCFECHIEPDWLLVYKYVNNELILLLVDTGSHSSLF